MEERSDGSDGPPKPQNSVLGWLASVRFDPLANLYEAWVPQRPQVLTVGTTRSEALSALRERLAEEVGVNPEVCEEVN